MVALPLAKFELGLKIAERLRPVPLIAVRVPPETTKSPAAPFQIKLAPGSSEKVKMMVAVSPDLSRDTSEVIATVGANVSMVIAGGKPAAPKLPAASW